MTDVCDAEQRQQKEKIVFRSVLIFLAALAPLVAQAQNSLRTSADIDSYLRGAVEATKIPGVVAMVVTRDETRYAPAAGQLSVASTLPMREDAIFRIHSMTKPLTSVAALMLIDQGLLKLDRKSVV